MVPEETPTKLQDSGRDTIQVQINTSNDAFVTNRPGLDRANSSSEINNSSPLLGHTDSLA